MSKKEHLIKVGQSSDFVMGVRTIRWFAYCIVCGEQTHAAYQSQCEAIGKLNLTTCRGCKIEAVELTASPINQINVNPKSLQVSQKRTCHGCKALEFSPMGTQCRLGYQIQIEAPPSGFDIRFSEVIPKEPCPKPYTKKALRPMQALRKPILTAS